MQAAYRLTLATFALLALCACSRGAADTGEVSREQLFAAQGGADRPFVLDVRTPEEFASGHVPGARNIPIDELASRTGELEAQRQREVVVYCERGSRARKAADALVAAGFTDVKLLAGHMSGWRDAGLPTE
ncbi:MAG TPA: rhodanese-like domain-containing protein [Myxococcota bacterium]|nr:rhodanese-like domain-containing protein [Myxococcota bacterium]